MASTGIITRKAVTAALERLPTDTPIVCDCLQVAVCQQPPVVGGFNEVPATVGWGSRGGSRPPQVKLKNRHPVSNEQALWLTSRILLSRRWSASSQGCWWQPQQQHLPHGSQHSRRGHPASLASVQAQPCSFNRPSQFCLPGCTAGHQYILQWEGSGVSFSAAAVALLGR